MDDSKSHDLEAAYLKGFVEGKEAGALAERERILKVADEIRLSDEFQVKIDKDSARFRDIAITGAEEVEAVRRGHSGWGARLLLEELTQRLSGK